MRKPNEPEVPTPPTPEKEVPQETKGADNEITYKEIFADPGQQILNDKLNFITGILVQIAKACEINLD